MKSIALAGRPYGHVPSHQYLDVEVWRRRKDFLLRITWGSAQGSDEERGRTEVARPTIAEVREVALRSAADDETRRYVETACATAAAAPGPKTGQINFRLTPETLATIKRMAAARGVTATAVIEEAVRRMDTP